MKRLDPHLSYISITSNLPNKDYVKAYDCRFLYVLSGEGELLTESESFSLSSNTLAYYPAGIPYFLKSSDVDPLYFVTVNFDFTRSYPKRTAPFGPVKPCDFLQENERPTQTELDVEWFCSAFTVESAFSLREDFVLLDSIFKKDELYAEEECAAFLKYLILKIANHFNSERLENKIVRRVSGYIEKNLTAKLDNNTVASAFGYHPYYLSSLFKLHMGKTLHSYVCDTRLKAAVDILLHTEAPISEIAEKCGFQNANHFSVKFKKKYGQPPSVWRARNSII